MLEISSTPTSGKKVTWSGARSEQTETPLPKRPAIRRRWAAGDVKTKGLPLARAVAMPGQPKQTYVETVMATRRKCRCENSL